MTLINAYSSTTLADGDEALFVIKAMVKNHAKPDQPDELVFRFYRCIHNLTPPRTAVSINEIPQGDRIIGTDEELTTLARLMFPILLRHGAKPNPF